GHRRVLVAQQYLRRSAADSWEGWKQEKRQRGLGATYTWNEFETHLRDRIEDPINRSQNQSEHYFNATQKQGQSVQDFVAYAERLRKEVPGNQDDDNFLAYLRAKFLPEIREGLLQYSENPTTRQGLIALAQRVEQRLKKKSGGG
ncbi:hypothetical protein LTR16_008082, partial [Cryomyces antarcticus]